MPVPTSIFPFVRAWSSSRIQPQKIARCTESTLRKILAYLVPFMKQPLSILFPLAAKSLPMWMRKVEQTVVPRVVPAQALGLGHRHQAAGIHGPTAVRLLQPKYSKPNTVQTGVGSARTGATPSYIRERLRRHPCSHWQETDSTGRGRVRVCPGCDHGASDGWMLEVSVAIHPPITCGCIFHTSTQASGDLQ